MLIFLEKILEIEQRVDWHGTSVGILGGEEFLASSLNQKQMFL